MLCKLTAKSTNFMSLKLLCIWYTALAMYIHSCNMGILNKTHVVRICVQLQWLARILLFYKFFTCILIL